MRALSHNTCTKNFVSLCLRLLRSWCSHWETAVTKKSAVFVPLYTLCGKIQNCTESLQVMYRVTKNICNILSPHYKKKICDNVQIIDLGLFTNNRFVTIH